MKKSDPSSLSHQETTTWKIVTGLSKVALALKSHSWKEAGGMGLTPTQGQILVHLNLGSKDSLRLSELANALGVTLPTCSNSVDSLVEKNLVTKSRSSADKRNLVLSLTKKGQREAVKSAGWPDFLIGAVDALDSDEKAVFLRSLLKMIRTLQEQGEISVSRMCVSCVYFQPHVNEDGRRPHHCAFVNAPFGDGDLRLECADHEMNSPEESGRVWEIFKTGHK